MNGVRQRSNENNNKNKTKQYEQSAPKVEKSKPQTMQAGRYKDKKIKILPTCTY